MRKVDHNGTSAGPYMWNRDVMDGTVDVVARGTKGPGPSAGTPRTRHAMHKKWRHLCKAQHYWGACCRWGVELSYAAERAVNIDDKRQRQTPK